MQVELVLDVNDGQRCPLLPWRPGDEAAQAGAVARTVFLERDMAGEAVDRELHPEEQHARVELGRQRPGEGLEAAHTAPDAPRVISGREPVRRLDPLAADVHPAAHGADLVEARVVLEGPAVEPAHVARLDVRLEGALPRQVERGAVRPRLQHQAQRPQRLDHLVVQRAHLRLAEARSQRARCPHVVLPARALEGGEAVQHVGVGVGAHAGDDADPAVGAVGAEPVAVEEPVVAGGDAPERIGCLMQQCLVELGQHRVSLPLPPGWSPADLMLTRTN